jgi:hypothetical protein
VVETRRGTATRANRGGKPRIAADFLVKEVAGAAAAKSHNRLPSGGATSATFAGSTVAVVGSGAGYGSARGAAGGSLSGSLMKSTH